MRLRLSHSERAVTAPVVSRGVVFSCFQPRQGRQMLAQGEAQPKASETLGRRQTYPQAPAGATETPIHAVQFKHLSPLPGLKTTKGNTWKLLARERLKFSAPSDAARSET